MLEDSKENIILRMFRKYLGDATVKPPMAVGVFGDRQMRSTEVGYNIAVMSDILFSNLQLGRVGVLDLQQRSSARQQTLSRILKDNSSANAVLGIDKIFRGDREKNLTEDIDSYRWRDGTTNVQYYLNMGNRNFKDILAENPERLDQLLNGLLTYQVDLLITILPGLDNFTQYDAHEFFTAYTGMFNGMVYVDCGLQDKDTYELITQQMSEPGAVEEMRDKLVLVPYNSAVREDVQSLLTYNAPVKILHRVIEDSKSKILELKDGDRIFPIILDPEIVVPEYEKRFIAICGELFRISLVHEKEII